MDKEQGKLSDDEKRLILFVASLAEATGLNKPSPDKEEKQKPAWQRFLESTGGTALITVVIGGILGQWVVSSINEGMKKRDNNLAYVRAFNDRMADAARSDLTQEQEIIKRAYDLIGRAINDAQDLISITGEEFDPKLYSGKERADIQKQRDDIRAEYINLDKQWRNESISLGLLMSFYHEGDKEVLKAWRIARGDVDKYKDCAEDKLRKYEQSGNFFASDETDKLCATERDKITEDLDNFTVTLEKARLNSIEKWNKPLQ